MSTGSMSTGAMAKPMKDGAMKDDGMKAPMKKMPHAREMASIGHLIAGAVSEAALVCATSDHRVRDARDFTSALLKMLAPFFQMIE